MSLGESYYWVFVTADSASKVAAFYKAKTSVTPTEMEGMFMFTFKKGSNPYFPDHGLVIEPNKQLTVGPPKTAITFNEKKSVERDEQPIEDTLPAFRCAVTANPSAA